MKNLEKYLDVILNVDEDLICCEVCKLRLGYDPCESDDEYLSYAECKEHHEKNKQWLKEEYIERPILTKNEKAILESIDKDYTYIARNKEGELHVYMSRPSKDGRYWQVYHAGVREFVFNRLFQFIKWEDSEPYSIEELLKCEVISDEN